MVPNDNPPPYEPSNAGSKPAEENPHDSDTAPLLGKKANDGQRVEMPTPTAPTMQAGPSYVSGIPAPMYHYANPTTGEAIMSPLPPSHPEMICLQEGRHVRHTKFGFLGIMAAIFWFPLGIGLCLLDRRVVCDRCGHTLEDGILCG